MNSLGRHALIIEDEMLIAIELEALLSDLGFTSFEIADRPNDALASAQRRRPDLITADYRIIDGTGVDAVDAIRASLGAIPVVFVTGNGDMVSCLDLPVIDKPIEMSAFSRPARRSALDALISCQRGRRSS